MIRPAIAAFAVVWASPAFAEEETSQSFDFTGFDAIEIAGVFDADITVGGDYAVELSGPADEMARVNASVKNGVLILDQRDRKRGEKRMGNREGVRAVISTKALSRIDISGVAEVDARGIKADDFSAKLSGVGEVTLSGECGSLEAKVSGVGELNAKALECETVNVAVSGVGEATVFADTEVDASVSGMGEITVFGEPEKVSKSGGLFSEINIK